LASFGHPCIYQWLSHLDSVTARHSSSGRQPNFAALNRRHQLYLAGRPTCWALAHILCLNNFNWVNHISLKCLIICCFQDSKPKGVEHLIDIENPNHVVRKTKKVSELDSSQSPASLTRKQRYCVCYVCLSVCISISRCRYLRNYLDSRGYPGNLEYLIPPGNSGSLLEFNWSWKFLTDGMKT